MLQELETHVVTETPTLTVSPAAAQAVNQILTERQLEGYALRVFVQGSGCCGVQFGMALDNQFHSNDSSFDVSGLKLVVDGVSLEYLHGATIDFVNDPMRGAGFVVNSPGAESHGHSHAEGEGCACGGSCACNN
jgi:iron-sulfur cluster assembly accessory protein